MNQDEIESYVAGLPNVQHSENFGYGFYFYGDDHRLPFLTMANSDNDYDKVSDLSRDGVFRINLGVTKATFSRLLPNPDASDIDYTVLNTFLPHPDYAKQHFICILNPLGENITILKSLISEAWEIAKTRCERKP